MKFVQCSGSHSKGQCQGHVQAENNASLFRETRALMYLNLRGLIGLNLETFINDNI